MKVEPLLVFSRAWVDRPLARRKGVRVLPARMLLGHVSKSARRSRAATSTTAREAWSRRCANRRTADRVARARRLLPR